MGTGGDKDHILSLIAQIAQLPDQLFKLNVIQTFRLGMMEGGRAYLYDNSFFIL